MNEVTRILSAIEQGNPKAGGELLPGAAQQPDEFAGERPREPPQRLGQFLGVVGDARESPPQPKPEVAQRGGQVAFEVGAIDAQPCERVLPDEDKIVTAVQQVLGSAPVNA